MKIEKIEIGRFGGLHDFRIGLRDGFNLIYAGNEGGKSTLMAFIKMMFYGSSARGGDPAKNPRKKYAPWDGGPMSGAVEFENGGIRYRLEKAFGASGRTDRTNLLNLGTGESEPVADSEEIGRKFFGMGASAFERSVYIGQIGSVISGDGDKEDEVTQRLVNMVSSGDERVSMKRVRQRLQSAKESLRSKSGRLGTLTELESRLSRLQDERRAALDAEQRRAELSRLYDERDGQKKLADRRALSARARCEQQRKLALMEKIQSLLDLLRRLEQARASLRSGGKTVDSALLQACRARAEKIRTQKALLGDKSDSRAECAAELARLTSKPEQEIPDGYFERARGCETRLSEVRASEEKWKRILLAQQELSRLLAQKEREAAVAHEPAPPRRNAGLPLLAAAAAVLVLSVIAGAAVHPAFFFGVAAAALLGVLGWGLKRRAAEGRGKPAPPPAADLDAAGQRISALRQALAEAGAEFSGGEDIAAARRELGALSDSETKLRAELDRLLADKGCRTTDELYRRQIRFQSYRTRLAEKRSQWNRAQAEETAAARALAQSQQALTEAVRPFAAVGAAAIGTADDALRELGRWSAALAQIHDLETRLAGERAGLPEDLQSAPAEALRAACGRLRESLLTECGGSLPEKLDEPALREMERQSEAERENSRRLEKDLLQTDNDIRRLTEGRRSLGEIDAEISDVRRRIGRQTDYYQCLEIAQQTLDEAFQRLSQSFGPVLNRRAAAVFGELTGGRYQSMTVSRNFDIEVQPAGDSLSHPWQYLSGGAADQAYFALRMAVSELLCQNRPRPPLMLDDVFGQYDDERTEQGLRFLLKAARESIPPLQILFFTCHRGLSGRVSALAPDVRTLDLAEAGSPRPLSGPASE